MSSTVIRSELSQQAAEAHHGVTVYESGVPSPVPGTGAFEALALLPPVATGHSSLASATTGSSCQGIQRGKKTLLLRPDGSTLFKKTWSVSTPIFGDKYNADISFLDV